MARDGCFACGVGEMSLKQMLDYNLSPAVDFYSKRTVWARELCAQNSDDARRINHNALANKTCAMTSDNLLLATGPVGSRMLNSHGTPPLDRMETRCR